VLALLGLGSHLPDRGHYVGTSTRMLDSGTINCAKVTTSARATSSACRRRAGTRLLLVVVCFMTPRPGDPPIGGSTWPVRLAIVGMPSRSTWWPPNSSSSGHLHLVHGRALVTFLLFVLVMNTLRRARLTQRAR